MFRMFSLRDLRFVLFSRDLLHAQRIMVFYLDYPQTNGKLRSHGIVVVTVLMFSLLLLPRWVWPWVTLRPSVKLPSLVTKQEKSTLSPNLKTASQNALRVGYTDHKSLKMMQSQAKRNVASFWSKCPLSCTAPIVYMSWILTIRQDWHSPVYSRRLEHIAVHLCIVMQFIP